MRHPMVVRVGRGPPSTFRFLLASKHKRLPMKSRASSTFSRPAPSVPRHPNDGRAGRETPFRLLRRPSQMRSRPELNRRRRPNFRPRHGRCDTHSSRARAEPDCRASRHQRRVHPPHARAGHGTLTPDCANECTTPRWVSRGRARLLAHAIPHPAPRHRPRGRGLPLRAQSAGRAGY